MRYILYILLCIPVLIISYPVVAIMLLTKWSGYTTIFGNSKWGRGNTNPGYMSKGYLQEYIWLVWRNPINNMFNMLSAPCTSYILIGNRNTGDHTSGGYYHILMGKYWEKYWVYPYIKTRCIRVCLGWKIKDKNTGDMCPLVFTISPFMKYSGSL